MKTYLYAVACCATRLPEGAKKTGASDFCISEPANEAVSETHTNITIMLEPCVRWATSKEEAERLALDDAREAWPESEHTGHTARAIQIENDVLFEAWVMRDTGDDTEGNEESDKPEDIM